MQPIGQVLAANLAVALLVSPVIAADTTTPDILPGVDLVTEEVEPGVYRVISDGVHDLEKVVLSVAISEGSVWMDSMGAGIFELGRPGKHLGTGGGFLAFAGDGTVWAASRDRSGDCCEGDRHLSLRSFDGEAWSEHGAIPDETVSVPDPWWPADYIKDFAVHPDGTVWQIAAETGDVAHTRVQHLGSDTWTTYAIGDGLRDFGCGVDCGEEWNIEITPDGMVWLGVTDGGLLRFDGTEWKVVRPLGGEDHGVIGLATNRDGILWAELWIDDGTASDEPGHREERHLARFDGQTWEVFPRLPALDDGVPKEIQAVDPDGSVWLTDTYTDQDHDGPLADPNLRDVRYLSLPVSFDGERWRRYPEVLVDWAGDPLNAPERRQDYGHFGLVTGHIAVGPDGTAWVSVMTGGGKGAYVHGLYVITPEAVVAAE